MGKMVELAITRELFGAPQHPYTEALLTAIRHPAPRFKRERVVLAGEVANPAAARAGCYFHHCCRYALEECRIPAPKWREIVSSHHVACHRGGELSLQGI